ncbi:fatty acid-binding protein 1, liver-like [Protopterus annectens]|uniref:fatty acid-binding protein 1, liver-like n=1 Tax=Protopterus annectens TaxID=7888 RepID=UPI001CF9FAD1|nr:fatty acid-binding protein 1, liver-like [Protopterus annectens]
MAFTGKYEMESQENFEQFMKIAGLPDDLIERGKDLKSITEIQQNGNTFKIVVTTGAHVITNNFTIGEEAEFEMINLEKVRAVANLEGGNKLVVVLKGVTTISELSGDKLIDTVSAGGVTYKRISKRV